MQRIIANSIPDYRFKIPSPVPVVFVAGSICPVGGIYLIYKAQLLPGIALLIASGLVGLFWLLLFLITDPERRGVARDRMIDAITWTGAEQVLDVGCGNGLVLLSAAKHLVSDRGKAAGIDIWHEIAGRQSCEALRRNAVIEGVADRIEVLEVDARKMPFGNGTFDVVFASLSLHHAGGRAGIQLVVAEMKRVLKPGGVVVLYDLFPAITIASRSLHQLGIKEQQKLSGGLLQVLRAH